MTIFYCFKIRDSPNLEDQVPVFISPRNRMAQLYSQALGSLFVTPYDSQDYNGGIRTRLHAGFLTTQVKVKVTVQSASPGKELSLRTRILGRVTREYGSGGKVKRHFLIANLCEGNMLPASYRLGA
jgi:hypothetical protein